MAAFPDIPKTVTLDIDNEFKTDHRTQNVIAYVPGAHAKKSSKYIVFSAHYDHLGKRGDDIYNGADDNGSAIFSDTQPYTWQQVSIKQAELQADYDAKQYQRNRAKEYPSIVNQLDELYHNGIDGWKATIQAIKDKYPKGDS